MVTPVTIESIQWFNPSSQSPEGTYLLIRVSFMGLQNPWKSETHNGLLRQSVVCVFIFWYMLFICALELHCPKTTQKNQWEQCCMGDTFFCNHAVKATHRPPAGITHCSTNNCPNYYFFYLYSKYQTTDKWIQRIWPTLCQFWPNMYFRGKRDLGYQCMF